MWGHQLVVCEDTLDSGLSISKFVPHDAPDETSPKLSARALEHAAMDATRECRSLHFRKFWKLLPAPRSPDL
jgi:hypothetical protein